MKLNLSSELINFLRSEACKLENPLGEKRNIMIAIINYIEERYLNDENHLPLDKRTDIRDILDDLYRNIFDIKFLSYTSDLEIFYQQNFKAIDELIFLHLKDCSNFTITNTPYYSELIEWAFRVEIDNILFILQDNDLE